MTPSPFRPALPREDGQAFVDYLDARCGGDRRLRERLLVFLQQWDHLTDDKAREPTVEEYAVRWRVSVPSTYRILDEFRDVFPTEATPQRVLAALWDGMGRPYWHGPELLSLLQVRVLANDASAVGQ